MSPERPSFWLGNSVDKGGSTKKFTAQLRRQNCKQLIAVQYHGQKLEVGVRYCVPYNTHLGEHMQKIGARFMIFPIVETFINGAIAHI